MLQEFLKECCTINGMVLAVGNRNAVAELEITQSVEPIFEGGAFHLAVSGWAAHLNLKEIRQVHFVKARERSGLIPYLLTAMLKDGSDTSVMTLFFPNPWLDENQRPADYQSERYEQFVGIRKRYLEMDPAFFVSTEEESPSS